MSPQYCIIDTLSTRGVRSNLNFPENSEPKSSHKEHIDGLVQDCSDLSALANGVTAVLHYAIDLKRVVLQ